MATVQKTNAGKPARIGKVYFANDKLHFHAGYAHIEGIRHRILLSPDEARELSRRVSGARLPIGARLARRLMRHYGL